MSNEIGKQAVASDDEIAIPELEPQLAGELSLEEIAETANGVPNRNSVRIQSVHWASRVSDGQSISGSFIGLNPKGNDYPYNYADRSQWDLLVTFGETARATNVEHYGAVRGEGFIALIDPSSTRSALRGFLITQLGVQRLASAPASVFNPDFLRAGQHAALKLTERI